MGIARSPKKGRQREMLVIALLQQPSLEKAALTVGMSASTAYRIKATPEFQEDYRRARSQAVSEAMARLQLGTGAAAATVLKIMLDHSTPAASRLRAADLVIAHAKDLEREDLTLRVQRLEGILAGKEAKKRRDGPT